MSSSWLTPYLHTASLLPLSLALPLLLLLPLLLFAPRTPPKSPDGAPLLTYADLPGPESQHWLWGCEKALYDDSPPGTLLGEWGAKYGGAWRFRGVLGAKNIVLTSRPSLTHILTLHPSDYPKPTGGRLWLGTLLGQGVLVTEGAVHTRQRKLLSRAFTTSALREQSKVFWECVGRVGERWGEKLNLADGEGEGEGEGERKGKVVDVQWWANRISLDAIGLAGFAYRFDSLEEPAPGEDVEGKKGRHPLARTFDRLTDSSGTYAAFVLRAMLFVFPGILKMPSKRTRSIGEVRKGLGEEVKRVRAEGGGGEKTVLGILEQAARDEGSGLDEEEVNAQIMTLVFAGYETTSCAISWALYELAQHPSTQSALRASLLPHPSPTFDTLNDPSTLPLLDSIVRETLRVHPPILDLHREATKDDIVPLDGGKKLWVEKGTIVTVPLNVLGLEEVRGEDGGVWRPERWLESSGGKGEKKAKEWAFADGPRACIGRTFAVMEIKAVLATLVREYVFEPVEGVEIEPFVTFVVRPRVKGERGSTLPLRVRRA